MSIGLIVLVLSSIFSTFIIAGPRAGLFVILFLLEAVISGFNPVIFWDLFLPTMAAFALWPSRRSLRHPHHRLPRQPASNRGATNPRLQNAPRRQMTPQRIIANGHSLSCYTAQNIPTRNKSKM